MYSVLYVDDEPALLELGKIFLERSGSITVETALSASEGLNALKKTAFNAIVSDYQMPEINGLDFLKILRKENNIIPFILFTGRGREEIVIDAVNNGVDYYLQKGGDPTSQFVELEHKIKLAIERRSTDNELKESRQRMTDIIDHLPDATFAIDLDGKVIAWSRAMEEMTSVPKEQILGTGDHSYALPFYGTRRPILLDLVLREDKEIEKKYPHITRKDHKLISDIYIPLLYGGRGAYLWFIASPLYDTHGNITGAIESIRDITDLKTTENELRGAYEQLTGSEEELRDQYDELKKGEDALRRSEENYRSILEDIQDVYYRSDTNGNLIMVSPSAAHLLGYSSVSELIGMNIAQSLYYDPEERSRLLAELNRMGSVTDYEVTLKRRDGTPVAVSTSSHKYLDENGNYLGVEGIFRDVTERKHAEEERAFNNVILLTQQETSPDAIFIVDETGKILNYNQKFIELWGIPEALIVSRIDEPVLQHVVAQLADPEASHYRLGYLSDHKEEKSFEELLLKDGRILERFSAPMLGATGKYYGRVWYFRDITARKKMEDSLRANEEKYRSLVNNLNVGVYRNTAGFPGQTLWANPAFVRMLGYDSLEECLKHPITDSYVNPEDRKKFIHMFEAYGFVRDYELALKKKNGTHIWVSINAQAKKNPYGTIAWIDGICDDITALKEAGERDRRHQFEMSRAIDYLPDATFIINRKGTVIAWNRAIEEMTGVCTKDILGKGEYEYAIPFYGKRRPILIDLIFASEDEIKKSDYLEIKRTGVILCVETPNSILQGKPAILRATAAPIYDETGNVAGAIETITDITQLKRAQEDLKESENRYRTIFENTGTAIVLLEENTIISIANAQFERLSGYTRDELEGKKSWTEFVVKEDLDRMLDQHRMRREQHEAALRHYEFRFVTKTGDIRNIFLTIDVIPGTKKSVASLMDITAQVRAQESLKLANRKLNLLSGITRHDIGNQLQALSGYLELSRKSLSDPTRTSEYTDKEMHITDTIASLINFTRDYEGLGMNAPVWQNITVII
ncbi:MAG: PAS domain S-box protein, partial [Methanoregula sp.]|nr:PAS domain S-box protein [Methanoregula sp.]